MSSKHVYDELSAYIDGECTDATRVARHLQSCPDCAHRHMELLKLSNHIRAVVFPPVDPAFTDKVIRRLEQGPPSITWFVPRRALALGLAALFTITTAALFFGGDFGRRPAPDTKVVTTGVDAWMEDEGIVLALAELLESEAWVNPYSLDEPEDDGEESYTVDELLDALATWTLEEVESDWYDEDLSGTLEALALEDPKLLVELVETHWNEV